MTLLSKADALEVIDKLIDMMLSKELSVKCLENVSPLLLDLFNFAEISNDGIYFILIKKEKLFTKFQLRFMITAKKI